MNKTDYIYLRISIKPAISLLAIFSVIFQLGACEINDKMVVTPSIPAVWENFNLSTVRLRGSNYIYDRFEQHKSYLLSLDHERLMTGVLKSNDIGTAKIPYPGWQENKGNGWGNYLSGASMMYSSLPETDADRITLKARIDEMIGWVKAAQANANLGGYFYFHNDVSKDPYHTLRLASDANVLPLRNLNGADFFVNTAMADMSFYQLHRMYAGLRDAYLYTGNIDAKEAFLNACNWVIEYTNKFSGNNYMQLNLETEHAGILELLIDAYSLSGELKYLDCAQRWVHTKNFADVFAENRDPIKGIHANAVNSKLLGYLRNYEMTGDEFFKNVITNAINMIINQHTLPLGGHGTCERYGQAGKLLDALNNNSSESCTTYNTLKIATRMFSLTGDPVYLNFYERAFVNQMLGTVDPDNNTAGGGFVYYQSLMPGQHRKYMGEESFYCCWETGLETHAKYAKSIWYNNGTDILLNFMLSSDLSWEEKGLKLQITSSYPEEGSIKVKVLNNDSFTGDIFIHIPAWVDSKKVELTLNASPVSVDITSGELLQLTGNWNTNDELEIKFPFGLRWEKSNDPSVMALFYGPVLMAVDMGAADSGYTNNVFQRDGNTVKTDFPNIPANSDDVNTWLIKENGKLRFKTTGLDKEYSFIPFSMTHHRAMSMYVRLIGDKEIAYKKKYVLDYVLPGIAGSDDASHNRIITGASGTKQNRNKQYRYISNGATLQYTFDTSIADPDEDHWAKVKLYGWDQGDNVGYYTVHVDGVLVGSETSTARIRQFVFPDKYYKIPKTLMQGKESIDVKFSVDLRKTANFYDFAIVSESYINKYSQDVERYTDFPIVLEAEWAQPRNIRNDGVNPPYVPSTNYVQYDGQSSRGAYLRNLNGFIAFHDIYIKDQGTYKLKVYYKNNFSPVSYQMIINGAVTDIEFPSKLSANFEPISFSIPLNSGFNTIKIEGTAANGIDIDYIEIDKQNDTSTESLKSIHNFNVFPNPVSNVLNVEGVNVSDGKTEISVFDISGREVLVRRSDNANSVKLDLSSLISGIYIIKLNTIDVSESVRVLKINTDSNL